MTFSQAKSRLIADLESGSYRIGLRGDVGEKNLLASGDMTAEDVARLVRACRGNQYQCKAGAAIGGEDLHVFQPVSGPTVWYVKAFFLIDDAGNVSVVVSVHPSEFRRRR